MYAFNTTGALATLPVTHARVVNHNGLVEVNHDGRVEVNQDGRAHGHQIEIKQAGLVEIEHDGRVQNQHDDRSTVHSHLQAAIVRQEKEEVPNMHDARAIHIDGDKPTISFGHSRSIISAAAQPTISATAQTVERSDGRVMLRSKTPSSMLQQMLEVSLVSQFRSFLRKASTGVLVLVTLAAFILGVLFTLVMTQLFTQKSTLQRSLSRANSQASKSRPLISGAGDSASDNDSVNDGVSDGVKSIVMAGVKSMKSIIDGSVPLFDGLADSFDDDDKNKDMDELVFKFDFESQDPVEPRTRRWQWCTPDEMRQLGLLTQAPTKPFQGYQRIDVSATHKDVEELLLGANVDFTQYDYKRDGETLLWRLLRAEAYFMIMDGELPSRRILVMMETVRLRWSFGGSVLTQKPDNTFLGSKACLPGYEKPGSESPSACAKEMWQKIFKLPADIANFVEDSMEDHEMQGFKGLRCVERCHIVDVKLITNDASYLKKVGLPNHGDFSSSDLQDEDVKDKVAKVVRSFKWMDMDECKASGITMSEYKPVSMMDERSNVDGNGVAGGNKTSLQKLRTFLFQAGVDINNGDWQEAKNGVSKIESLSKELASGSCSVIKNRDGLHRCVNVVAMRLWSPDRKLMLVEKGRKYPSGEEEWGALLPGFKKTGNENVQEAGLRVCQDLLQFTEDNIFFADDSAWEYFEYTENSSRYTGLLTKYQKFFVDVVLEDDEDLYPRVGLVGRVHMDAGSGLAPVNE